MTKWWLSLIKIFSLTTGIISFLLVLLFYFDQQFVFGETSQMFTSCSLENVFFPGAILLVTTIIYFLVMKSQIGFRHKELFLRKFYGESKKGITTILLIETSIFIIISFVLSLVLIDQIAPFFNMITDKQVDLRRISDPLIYLVVLGFVAILGIIVGIVPSIWYTRKRAVDILKKLPD